MKVCVFSLGCKVNQYEGQGIASALKQKGYETFEGLGFADVYILNTCSVTSEADSKSRQAVSRALKYNPYAKILVVGCSSQNNVEAYRQKNNVVMVGGTGNKIHNILQAMSDIDSEYNENCLVFEQKPAERYEDVFDSEIHKTRGFLKIQDGCNRFCTYCIVPYLRGRSRSRDMDAVLAEAKKIALSCNEIVLTGVDVSAYGKDIGVSFNELLKRLSEVPVRKRLGSLECSVIDRELLQIMKDGGYCPHFHLSFQSGSAGVLKRMNRKYSPEEFYEKVLMIREFFPLGGITTDIICGFPEESEEEHFESLENVKKIGFSKIHVFPYSERAGTIAASMRQVDKAIRKRRAEEMARLGQELHEKFLLRNIGKKESVLIEEKEGEYFVGHTGNYIKVYVADGIPGQISDYIIKNIYKEGVIGVK